MFRIHFPWQVPTFLAGVSTDEAMTGNLSLTLEDITESAAKAIAAQQKLLDSLAKVILDNRIVLNYLLAEQGGVCAVANATCCTWISTSAEVETQLHKATEQATWLKKVTPSMGPFFDLFDFDWFGSWRPQLQSALQTLGIILLIIILVVSLACCILSKALNACSQPLTTKRMISLRLEHQKRNKENGRLKRREPEIMTCEYHTGISKNCKNFRAVAGSGTSALNFDHISQLG